MRCDLCHLLNWCIKWCDDDVSCVHIEGFHHCELFLHPIATVTSSMSHNSRNDFHMLCIINLAQRFGI